MALLMQRAGIAGVTGRPLSTIPNVATATDLVERHFGRDDRDRLWVTGTQFPYWAFTRRAIDSGLLPSMGSVGGCFVNAMIESF